LLIDVQDLGCTLGKVNSLPYLQVVRCIIVIYCASCGKQIDDEANFCPKCGTRTAKAVRDGVSIPFSETQMKADIERAIAQASKAIDEGVKIAQIALQDVVTRVDEEVRIARGKSRDTSAPFFCIACGGENNRTAKYCMKCGKELK
jgi:predicted amidophosphoribosyltransferase